MRAFIIDYSDALTEKQRRSGQSMGKEKSVFGPSDDSAAAERRDLFFPLGNLFPRLISSIEKTGASGGPGTKKGCCCDECILDEFPRSFSFGRRNYLRRITITCHVSIRINTTKNSLPRVVFHSCRVMRLRLIAIVWIFWSAGKKIRCPLTPYLRFLRLRLPMSELKLGLNFLINCSINNGKNNSSGKDETGFFLTYEFIFRW